MKNSNNFTFLNELITIDPQFPKIFRFSMTFLHNTNITKEVFITFIKEFYDQVISQTNYRISLMVKVRFVDQGTHYDSYPFTLTQYIDISVPQSLLVNIINCFWANRTAFLNFKVEGIYIEYKYVGDGPVILNEPTPEKPAVLLANPKDRLVHLNPIFPGDDTLEPLFNNFHTLPLSPSTTTTSSATSTTPSTDSSTSSGTTPSGTNSSNSSTDSLPHVIEFTNLHLTKNLKAAKEALNGLAGVYAIICNVTGAIYIGSSINIGNRLVNHLVSNNTNEHLQNAINCYGIEDFVFVVVEVFKVDPELSLESNKANLLAMEQKHLDWLFSLPESLRYNFLSTAGSSLGYIHSEETRAKISEANSGANNPMYGKVPANAFQSGANNPIYGRTGALSPRYGKVPFNAFESGANHPMYGKVPTHAMTINVYSEVDNQLVRSFSSQVAVAEWLGVSRGTVQNYIKSGKVWNNLYIFRKSS